MAQGFWDIATAPRRSSLDAPALLAPKPYDTAVTLPRRRVVLLLGGCIVALTLLSLAGQIARFHFDRPFVFGLVDFFYVDMENNLPTWYQSANFLFAALLLAAIFYTTRRDAAPFAYHWGILAAGFTYLSMDEMAGLHERLINPLQRVIQPSGAWSPTWVVAGAIGVAIVGLLFLPFILHLSWRLKSQIVAAGALFVGGAIGVEMITATMFDTTDPAFKNSFDYALMAHIEEVLEMLGLLVFLDALMRRLGEAPPITFMVADRTG